MRRSGVVRPVVRLVGFVGPVVWPVWVALPLVCALSTACGVPAASPTGVVQGKSVVNTVSPRQSSPELPRAGEGPLAGKIVVIDPGHQLGNRNFPAEINRPVAAGGATKPCNTTGTSTDAGYAEATFVWHVARLVTKRLRTLGATVRMTRHSNRDDRWGPCVDVRGRAGNRIGADLKVSIHADGSQAAGARGFYVIAPADRTPWTHDIYAPSRTLAETIKAALVGKNFVPATYTAGGDGLDVRSDLATLNLSDVPTVMVELGNMRDSAEADVMSSPRGRQRYARGLVAGIRSFLG